MNHKEWPRLVRTLRRVLRKVQGGIAWCTHTVVSEELVFHGRSIGRGKCVTVFGGSWHLVEAQVVLFDDGRLAGYNPHEQDLITQLPDTIDIQGVIRWIAEQCCADMTPDAIDEWDTVLRAA